MDDYVAFGVNPELTSNTSIKAYPGTNILIIKKPTTQFNGRCDVDTDNF